VALVALLASLLLAEGIVRARQWLKYGTTEASFYHMIEDPGSGLIIPEPDHSIGPIVIDSRGFRSPELELPKPEGRLRIGFLGGSTTFCAESTTQQGIWPYLLVEALKKRDPAHGFDFVNGAAAGYSTEQSSINLEKRMAPLEPDVLIIYHGTNDLTQDTRRLAAAEGLFDPEAMETDVVGRYWLCWYLLKKNFRFRTRQNPAGKTLRLEYDPETSSHDFHQRLTKLIREAKRVAPVVCLVTFSQRARAEQAPEERREASSSSLYYMPYLGVDTILAGFEEYNRVIRQVAAETGVLLVEGENDIPGDAAHFRDSVHLSDQGLALQAERVFEVLSEAPGYRALVDG
jgi:lysophospholipase L1-like esterase